MPKRSDIHKILLIGSGPIVIGQACEFDYSGTQACKALKEEGYEVVLVNSNPATIMTDPDLVDRTYIEPLTLEVVSDIIRRERPDALLPTMGGQTALNLATGLFDAGILQSLGVTLIGASYDAIKTAEDRVAFKKAMERVNLQVPESHAVKTVQEALSLNMAFPLIIRPSFTLGGTGAGVVYHPKAFEAAVHDGLAASPIHEVLIEESLLQWKEFELELMRDKNDNVVVVCSIENLDPMGTHTGDSITVAPVQTLTDRAYQAMRDAAIQTMRAVGVDTGGSNIQFAVHPKTGAMRIIEMNPRVSRSSALASKATGFPIAKIAAKLAVGYTLDEIQNDITRVTPACFEPTLDYVVVKIPRFAFSKFQMADPTLTLKMKSVGEVMAIGRNFKEALQKAIRALDQGAMGLSPRISDVAQLRARLPLSTEHRIFYVADALRQGIPLDEIHALTHIDPWFLHQIQEVVEIEAPTGAGATKPQRPLGAVETTTLASLSPAQLRAAKQAGYSDHQVGRLIGCAEEQVAAWRKAAHIVPVYKRVDTCGAEFEAVTPYFYSSYDSECEAFPTDRPKVMILGSGPNRIGQGIEFDYCCVHAAQALRECGYESLMVNCNPETVSTDYDTSDRLYFEPITFEDVMAIIEKEKPIGVVVQFGGQTPLNLAGPLSRAGVPILGTTPAMIDCAEDREQFQQVLSRLGLTQPKSGLARNMSEALTVAKAIGFPILLRPSYVLGGQAMEIVYDAESLEHFAKALQASEGRPLLIDEYLEDAIEVDVDAVSDGDDVVIGGIMEHIEEAGIHSGDSASVLPPHSLPAPMIQAIRDQTILLARALSVKGLMNVQFAVKSDRLYILEVNPRGSRTVPFVSKVTGVPLAKVAMKVVMGTPLRLMGLSEKPLRYIAVKEAVFPFKRFDVDSVLGPEMKSTGEVMGIAYDFGMAYAKAQAASENRLPVKGKVFLSVKDRDKPKIIPIAQSLLALGFDFVATSGTARSLAAHGISAVSINKVKEGSPHIVDLLRKGEVHLVINTVGDRTAQKDSLSIRTTVLQYGIPYFTTITGAKASVAAITALQRGAMAVQSLQEYYQERDYANSNNETRV